MIEFEAVVVRVANSASAVEGTEELHGVNAAEALLLCSKALLGVLVDFVIYGVFTW